MDEVWKDVRGYEGYYEVSNFGNVRSLTRTYERVDAQGNKTVKTFRGKLLSPYLSKGRNSLQVGLCKGGKMKNVPVHSIVAEAFVDNPDNGRNVKHIDGNMSNNVATNLQWITPTSDVRCLVKDNKLVLEETTKRVFDNIKSASAKTDVREDVIKRSIKKHCYVSSGLKFSIVEKC